MNKTSSDILHTLRFYVCYRTDHYWFCGYDHNSKHRIKQLFIKPSQL